MKPYEPPRIIRIRQGPVTRYLKCSCGYRSGKIVAPAGEPWEGAVCPVCGRRLRVDGVEHAK